MLRRFNVKRPASRPAKPRAIHSGWRAIQNLNRCRVQPPAASYGREDVDRPARRLACHCRPAHIPESNPPVAGRRRYCRPGVAGLARAEWLGPWWLRAALVAVAVGAGVAVSMGGGPWWGP